MADKSPRKQNKGKKLTTKEKKAKKRAKHEEKKGIPGVAARVAGKKAD